MMDCYLFSWRSLELWTSGTAEIGTILFNHDIKQSIGSKNALLSRSVSEILMCKADPNDRYIRWRNAVIDQ